jgi:hypothetical protein
MPVSIGEVQSEVLVDPPEQHGRGQAGAGQGRAMPTHEETERWRRIARRRERDIARTSADDFDD